MFEDCECLFVGDFNSRRADLVDFVEQDKTDFISSLSFIMNDDGENASVVNCCRKKIKVQITLVDH